MENFPVDFRFVYFWPLREKLEYLQRRVILHSILYYELDKSIIADETFDDLSRQLVWYQTEYEEEAKRTRYWYVLKGFAGETGFYIYSKLDEQDKVYLMKLAQMCLYSLYREKGGRLSDIGKKKRKVLSEK